MDEDAPDVFQQHFTPTARRAARDGREVPPQLVARPGARRLLANVPTLHGLGRPRHPRRLGIARVRQPDDGRATPARRGDLPQMQRRTSKTRAMSTGIFRVAAIRSRATTATRLLDQPDPAFPNYIDGPLPHGLRLGMPFVFRCGRLMVLMLDSRGERDVFRKDYPILGQRQWTFIDDVFAAPAGRCRRARGRDGHADRLAGPGRRDAAPDGRAHRRCRGVQARRREGALPPERTTKDVGAREGDRQREGRPPHRRQPNLGDFQISNLDEARDQWSHRFPARAAGPAEESLSRRASPTAMPRPAAAWYSSPATSTSAASSRSAPRGP